MRLIDADVLVRDINTDPYRTESEKSYDRCLVHRQPTIEATPVVHGRWEWDTEDIYKCSNCGNKSHVKEVMGQPDWDYCPNCGAKMDGGVSDG